MLSHPSAQLEFHASVKPNFGRRYFQPPNVKLQAVELTR
jgi:hypothetical protein